MKGTAPRCADPQADRQSAQRLRHSEKDQAENLMIVDLLRNDLGRITKPGSVRVSSLFDLEAYPSVWTLTSTVEAEAPDIPLEEVLRALFPCGSVTGAPKIAALDVIAELEPTPRGPYCGALGWVDADQGTGELNVAIRTFWFAEGRLWFGTGGGITWGSDPAGEWAETELKAARLLRVASTPSMT